MRTALVRTRHSVPTWWLWRRIAVDCWPIRLSAAGDKVRTKTRFAFSVRFAFLTYCSIAMARWFQWGLLQAIGCLVCTPLNAVCFWRERVSRLPIACEKCFVKFLLSVPNCVVRPKSQPRGLGTPSRGGNCVYTPHRLSPGDWCGASPVKELAVTICPS